MLKLDKTKDGTLLMGGVTELKIYMDAGAMTVKAKIVTVWGRKASDIRAVA
jgi:hypothetical protein